MDRRYIESHRGIFCEQLARGLYYKNVLVNKKESKLDKDSAIITAQFYAIDRQRLIERISKVKRETMEKVENGMMLVLGINIYKAPSEIAGPSYANN